MKYCLSSNSGALKYLVYCFSQERDHLTRMKQARDALRIDNIKLRQKGGLVCHSALLRDFEERRDQVSFMPVYHHGNLVSTK